ncbi:MAG: HAMP domain-containing sensor histidine kinase [Gemmatimonadota bacterium]
MIRWRRWSWLVTLPLVLVLAVVVVSLVYVRRDFYREVNEDLPWPVRVAQADIDAWRTRWEVSTRSTAALLATNRGDSAFQKAVLSAAAVDGATLRVVTSTTPTATSAAEGVVTLRTVRCGERFCVEVRSPILRAPVPRAPVAEPPAAREMVVAQVPLTDSTFAALDVPGASKGSRASILMRQGDSVFVLATAAHDSVPLRTRVMAWGALPPHVRDAFAGRRRTGLADSGLVRESVVYATARYPDLGWLLLREVDSDEVIERLLAPLGVELLVISTLLLFALGFAKSRRREVAMRREAALAEVRGDFVAAVSHELRTPLAQISLFAELLRKGSMRGPEEQERALHVIEKEASRLSILVDNVLNHARLRRGEGTRSTFTASATTDVGRDVEQVMEAFAPLAADRGVHVVARGTGDGIVAAVDSQALRQTLLNFLENAVKYGPRGQTVTVAVTESPGRVRVSVSDQGPGVAAAELETIWSAFTRGSAARASQAGGSGIGLSVVRDLVAQYKGTVRVENADGGGARFEASFPSAVARRQGD